MHRRQCYFSDGYEFKLGLLNESQLPVIQIFLTSGGDALDFPYGLWDWFLGHIAVLHRRSLLQME